MVGALSIVRFRTAVKEPIDLVFMFWAISVGIICGAGLIEIAVILSIGVSIIAVVLISIPVSKAPMILIIIVQNDETTDTRILLELKDLTKGFKEKSRNLNSDEMELVFRVKTENEHGLVKRINAIEGVNSAQLVYHDGDVMY